MSHNYLFKYIIIGDTSVGKSCLLLKFMDGTFRQKHEITIGVEFGSKILKVGGKSVKLQVWDTAGQESFKSITRGYYRSAAAALLVYDVTSEKSFRSVERWLEDLKQHSSSNIEIILVGNKSDLVEYRKISYEYGAALARSKNIPFVEVSAKSSERVYDAFKKPAYNLLARLESGSLKLDKNTVGIKSTAVDSEKNTSITNLLPLLSMHFNDNRKKTCC